jgi:hypothetical protein
MAQTQEHAGLTARQIITNLQNLIAGGRQTDDVRISDRQWLFNLDHHRAQLLRQQAEKGQRINEANVQELGIWNKQDKVRELTVKKQKCGRWFTDTDIPQAVELYQDNLFTFVGTLDGHAFQHTTAQKVAWEKFARFTRKEAKWYQLGGTLFLVNPPSPSTNLISVKGVFENPRAVKVFNQEELDPLDYLNFEYPISRTALDTLTKMLIDGELKLSMAIPYDYQNDGKDHQMTKANA